MKRKKNFTFTINFFVHILIRNNVAFFSAVSYFIFDSLLLDYSIRDDHPLQLFATQAFLFVDAFKVFVKKSLDSIENV